MVVLYYDQTLKPKNALKTEHDNLHISDWTDSLDQINAQYKVEPDVFGLQSCQWFVNKSLWNGSDALKRKETWLKCLTIKDAQEANLCHQISLSHMTCIDAIKKYI